MTDILMDRYRYAPPGKASFNSLTVSTNSESPTATDTSGRGLLVQFGVNPAAGDNLRGFFKAANSATAQSVIARFDFPTWGLANYFGGGLAFSDGTKFNVIRTDYRNAVPYMFIDDWTNSTTFGSTLLSFPWPEPSWVKWDVVGGHPQTISIGPNGTDWMEMYNTSDASLSALSYVGFVVYANRSSGNEPISGAQQMFLNVLYYSDPDIVPGF